MNFLKSLGVAALTLGFACGAASSSAQSSSAQSSFDQSHKAFDDLLKKHVTLISNGNASQLSYAGVSRDHAALKAYLEAVSSVSESNYRSWTKNQQLAFLINAYNAYTIELILTKYPHVKSIRDLGGTFSKPWGLKFFKLFGKESTLDTIEHDMIRAEGVFNDPRIHVAVVCASVGCPMLRNEAFVAEKIDTQLEDGMKRFLSDASRNRFNPESKKLEVSKIFDWYKKDFSKGFKGFSSLEATLGKYADRLTTDPATQADIRAGKIAITYLDYDWSLNDKR